MSHGLKHLEVTPRVTPAPTELARHLPFLNKKESAYGRSFYQDRKSDGDREDVWRLVASSAARLGDSYHDQHLSRWRDPFRRGRSGTRRLSGRPRQGQVIRLRP